MASRVLRQTSIFGVRFFLLLSKNVQLYLVRTWIYRTCPIIGVISNWLIPLTFPFPAPEITTASGKLGQDVTWN